MKDTRLWVVRFSEHSNCARREYLAKKGGRTFAYVAAKAWKTRRGAEKWVEAHRKELSPHYSMVTPLNGAVLFELVRDYIFSNYGANEGRFRDWTMPTKLGPLDVSVSDDWIACCFHDTEAARKRFGHWKWNWGCGERMNPDELFQQWKRAVEELHVSIAERLGAHKDSIGNHDWEQR